MRCPTPNFVWPTGVVMAVPCGKCLACLSSKRYDWSFRLMQEYRVASSAHFVTLTYSEKFVPDGGLVKRHLQLYLKRLRKKTPKLRYYAVGEYGEETRRPHYHAIIFNAREKDIRSSWTLRNAISKREEPIGIVHVGSVTEASVQYTLKYIVQKDVRYEGLRNPFSIMSRGYGLGLNYLTDAMVAWHRADDRIYIVVHGQKIKLPRYFKDKIWPKSEWSNWTYRREQVFKKARREAEVREEKDDAKLKELGYTKEQKLEFRNAEIARIRKKVSFTQKL